MSEICFYGVCVMESIDLVIVINDVDFSVIGIVVMVDDVDVKLFLLNKFILLICVNDVLGKCGIMGMFYCVFKVIVDQVSIKVIVVCVVEYKEENGKM